MIRGYSSPYVDVEQPFLSEVPHYAHFQVHTFILRVSSRIFIFFTVKKYSPILFHAIILQHLYSPSVRTLYFSSCLFKSPFQRNQSVLIGQLSQS